MAGRVVAGGRRWPQRIRGYEVVINDAVRLLADQGFVPPADWTPPAAAAGTGLRGRCDPAGLGTPLMAGYAADPVNTALGNFVEVETDLPFSGLLAGLTFARTYNSRSDRTARSAPRWSALGDHPAGRARLDRGVRGPGRAAGQLPADRSRVRPGGRHPRAGRAPRAG